MSRQTTSALPVWVQDYEIEQIGRRATFKDISLAQLRQRELAWILYISEGYIANLEHALRVNCVTFENADHDAVAELISTVRDATDIFRQSLNSIAKD